MDFGQILCILLCLEGTFPACQLLSHWHCPTSQCEEGPGAMCACWPLKTWGLTPFEGLCTSVASCLGLKDSCAGFSFTWISFAAVTQPLSVCLPGFKKPDEAPWGVVGGHGVSVLQDEESAVDGWCRDGCNSVNALSATGLLLESG